MEILVQWVVRIELESSVDIFEVTPNPSHHHVAGTELRRRVAWLKYPACHSNLRPGCNNPGNVLSGISNLKKTRKAVSIHEFQ